MTFGEKLSQLRKKRGMSQEELAHELKVSRQAISRWELGEVVPDTANVVAASRLFGVSTDYLLLEECQREEDTPAALGAVKSLKERQEAVGKGFLLRILVLVPVLLFHQYRLNQLEGVASVPIPLPWLLVPTLVFSLLLGRLNRRYVLEGGRLGEVLVPDLLSFACCLLLPYWMTWVPGQWGIFLSVAAASICITKSVKVLRLHYSLPWGRKK